MSNYSRISCADAQALMQAGPGRIWPSRVLNKCTALMAVLKNGREPILSCVRKN